MKKGTELIILSNEMPSDLIVLSENKDGYYINNRPLKDLLDVTLYCKLSKGYKIEKMDDEAHCICWDNIILDEHTSYPYYKAMRKYFEYCDSKCIDEIYINRLGGNGDAYDDFVEYFKYRTNGEFISKKIGDKRIKKAYEYVLNNCYYKDLNLMYSLVSSNDYLYTYLNYECDCYLKIISNSNEIKKIDLSCWDFTFDENLFVKLNNGYKIKYFDRIAAEDARLSGELDNVCKEGNSIYKQFYENNFSDKSVNEYIAIESHIEHTLPKFESLKKSVIKDNMNPLTKTCLFYLHHNTIYNDAEILFSLKNGKYCIDCYFKYGDNNIGFMRAEHGHVRIKDLWKAEIDYADNMILKLYEGQKILYMSKETHEVIIDTVYLNNNQNEAINDYYKNYIAYCYTHKVEDKVKNQV